MFVRGCEKFLPALAYLFCLALPGSCLARFTYFFWEHCTYPKTTLSTNLISCPLITKWLKMESHGISTIIVHWKLDISITLRA